MRSLFLFLIAVVFVACDKTEVRLHHIYLAPAVENLAPGESVQFEINAYPADATTGFPTGTPVWSSSDTTVVSVSQGGLATALKYGVANVRVDYPHFSAERKLMVSAIAEIPDPHFFAFLLSRFDADHDGKIEGYETYSTTSLDLSALKLVGSKGVSFDGIENFPNLQIIRMEYVTINHLDLSRLHYLHTIDFEGCDIVSLDLRANSSIEHVRCLACPTLQEIVFGSYETHGRNNLSTLQCDRCDIRSLDLSRCGRTLGDIDCRHNPNLTTLDLSVDTMIHTVKYSADVTNVIWPDVEVDIITRVTE